MRMSGLAALVVVGAVVAATLTGCTQSGDGIARSAGEDAAADVAAALDREGIPTATADYLAASDAFGPRAGVPGDPAVVSTVRPVEWDGETVDEGGARIVIRVTTVVEAYSPSTIGSSGNSAGRDESCFEIRVTAVRSDESIPRRVGCPDQEQAIPTDPSGPLRLPDQASESILAALRDGTDESSIREALTTAMPEGVSIQVEAYQNGFVAAVGATPSRECVVAIRDAAGEVRLAGGWPPEREQPGELGCSTDLVTRQVH